VLAAVAGPISSRSTHSEARQHSLIQLNSVTPEWQCEPPSFNFNNINHTFQGKPKPTRQEHSGEKVNSIMYFIGTQRLAFWQTNWSLLTAALNYK
ncbi:hypothetical protein HN51_040319, partial [Arachis hypogaea]